MAFVLGHNQYGKAENRVVRVFRDSDPHEIVDYNVSVALSGGQDPPHLTGDNAPVLPTDTQKNTVYAFAKDDDAVAQPESFGIRLARHFVDDTQPITRARVKLEVYPWSRLSNPHAGGRQSGDGVQHVRGEGAHGCSSLSSRSRVILRSSSATTPHSVSGSLPSRWRSAASSSSADRPLARIRKTWPKRAS